METKFIVLYHAYLKGGTPIACMDGFAAAYAAYRFFKLNSWFNLDPQQFKFVPVDYRPIPADVMNLFPGVRTVYIVDWSAPVEEILQIEQMVERVVIIDHHNSAEERLLQHQDKLTKTALRFRQGQSGAELTWEFFFPHEPVPELFRLIADRDLGRVWHPEQNPPLFGADSYALNMGLRSLNVTNATGDTREFAIWDAMLEMDFDQLRKLLLAVGRVAVDKEEDVMQKLLLCNTTWTIAPEGYLVPLATGLPMGTKSELLNRLIKLLPGIPFAATLWHNKDWQTGQTESWDLRSHKNGFHVGEYAARVAEAAGSDLARGGGHQPAAGFTIPLTPEEQQRFKLPLSPDQANEAMKFIQTKISIMPMNSWMYGSPPGDLLFAEVPYPGMMPALADRLARDLKIADSQVKAIVLKSACNGSPTAYFYVTPWRMSVREVVEWLNSISIEFSSDGGKAVGFYLDNRHHNN